MAKNKTTSYVEIIEEDENQDGITDWRSLQTNYDKNGNLISAISESDYGADGTIDYWLLRQYEYDKRGNLISEISEFDFGPGGIMDRATSKYAYDKKGNKISEVYESDYDADEYTDHKSSSKYGYDKKGNLISALTEKDYDADGTIDYRYVKYPVDTDDIIASLPLDSLDFLLLQ
jgi:serralysin